MCWSGEASAVLAAMGFGTVGYSAYRHEPKELWVPLAYFSLMEALQAATYRYIDQCGLPENQILTLLGYLHIAFQPFFVNMVALYFVPRRVAKAIRFWVYLIAGAGAIAILLKMYPLPWLGLCRRGYEGFCGTQVCSLHGDWHISWQIPLNALMSGYSTSVLEWFPWGLHAFAYASVSFLLPVIYGSWRFVVFHLLVGPVLADLVTVHPNEDVAVWCLFSIGLCVSVLKTPLRRHLRVSRWPLFARLAWRDSAMLGIALAGRASNDQSIPRRRGYG